MGAAKIWIWSTPRASSTVIEHALRQAPGTTGFHEPFLEYYYLGPERGTTIFESWEPSVLLEKATYAAVEKEIGERIANVTTENNIVVKDLSFYHLGPPPAFCAAFAQIFLLRHPIRIAESFLRATKGEVFPEREFGFEAQGRLLDHAKATGAKYLVVGVEKFMSDPKSGLEEICDFSGLEFVDAMLEWEPKVPRPDWPRSIRLFAEFYTSVLASSGFDASKKAPKPLDHLYAQFPPWLQGYVDRALPVYTRLIDISSSSPP